MHSLNDSDLITVTEDGISIWLNDEQSRNVSDSIEVTDDGIMIDFKEEQLKKLLFPIFLTEFGISICSKKVHFLHQLILMKMEEQLVLINNIQKMHFFQSK